MIIRTQPTSKYTSLPNAIFRDRRLALDTKALLAYLLSLPPSWEIRPRIITKALSPATGRQLGKDRLRRMFKELINTGYMARSADQTKDNDGFFGPYIYIVGSEPRAVEAEADALGVAFLPQSALPSTGEPSTGEPSTGEPSTGEPSTANPPPYKETKEKKDIQIQKENEELQFGEAAIVEAEQDKKFQVAQEARVLKTAPRSKKPERPEIIQNRIAERLGSRGWTILMDLSACELDQLTAQERFGRLTDQHLAELHLRYPPPGVRPGSAA
jgi:hypothetical protein